MAVEVPSYVRRMLSKTYESINKTGTLESALKRVSLSSKNVDDFIKSVPKQATVNPFNFHTFLYNFTGSSFHSKVLRFDLNAEEITDFGDFCMESEKRANDELAALKPEDCTTENVLLRLQEESQAEAGMYTTACFAKDSHPDENVRKASADVASKFGKFGVEQSMRMDVFKTIKTYSEKVDRATLSETQKRFLDFIMRDYRRQGMDLPEKEREELTDVKKEISDLQLTFSRNLGENKWERVMTEEQLKGCPESFLKPRAVEGGYKVTLDYPDVFPIVQNCVCVETRKLIDLEFSSRCKKENTEIIEKLVGLRAKQAKILGYPTHAAYVLETRMAKSPKVVWDFVQDVKEKIAPMTKADYDALLVYKKSDCEENGMEFDGKVNSWDWRYYNTIREQKEFDIDKEAYKQYFPLEVVTKGMLDIYQELLNLKFTEVKGSFWHEDVQLFQVEDKDTKKTLGNFFLDLHPREGNLKCKFCDLKPDYIQESSDTYDFEARFEKPTKMYTFEAAVFPQQKACPVLINGKKQEEDQLACCAMLCNFPKSTEDQPSLLPHSDVETYFHEFGHVMHNICAKVEIARFGGTSVERDFVEAPSQMLEYWCWDARVLKRLSGRLSDGKPLPDGMIENLIKSKHCSAGLKNSRQLTFGIIDQIMHTNDQVDTQKLAVQISEEILRIPFQSESNFIATWGHVGGGYDAQYYGYMWSEVYAADMYYTKFKENPLSTEAGLHYRNTVIGKGGSVDGFDMLQNFLGREPKTDAFFLELGLKSAKM